MNIEDVLKSHGMGASSGSNIKSMQRGSGTLAIPNGSIAVPISAVDITKSIVKVTYRTAMSSSGYGLLKGVLTDATTLTLSRVSGAAGTVYFSWEIIEFNNVKSKQTGLYSLTTVDATITINSIDLSKSIILCSWAGSGETELGAWSTYLEYKLNSATQIYFNSTAVIYGSRQISWQVIEFN